MKDEKKTFENYGYHFDSLLSGSNKPVCLICDYCGSDIKSTPKIRGKSNKHLEKDACIKCKFLKRADVSMARDGVSNSAKRPDVRKKISDFGWINSAEFNEKSSKTMMDKYGVINAMESEVLKGKLKSTLVDKYGVDNIMKYGDVAKEASVKSINTKIDRGVIKYIEGKTLPQHAKEIGFSRSHFGKLVRKYGFEEAIIHERKTSSLELAMMKLLDSESVEYTTQLRIEGKVADFVIGNVIIEVDGLYWHSDVFVENDYHSEKLAIYKKNGYRALFFREDEVRDKPEIVKSIILNALGQCKNKYFARKLEVRPVDFKIAREFVRVNHLMGPTSNVTCSYGLFDGDELISLIQIKRLKDNDYDIARFCNKLNTSVVGGFSRLLKRFRIDCRPASISTFIDLRYGTGDYLPGMNFKFISCHNSFKWTNFTETCHRMKYKGSSGYEQGFYKVWDCGQARYLCITT